MWDFMGLGMCVWIYLGPCLCIHVCVSLVKSDSVYKCETGHVSVCLGMSGYMCGCEYGYIMCLGTSMCV